MPVHPDPCRPVPFDDLAPSSCSRCTSMYGGYQCSMAQYGRRLSAVSPIAPSLCVSRGRRSASFASSPSRLAEQR